MGNGIATNQLMKMVAGAVNPGRPVANLYVSGSHSLDSSSPEMTSSSLCGVMMSFPLLSISPET